jgi:hypothetical protein
MIVNCGMFLLTRMNSGCFAACILAIGSVRAGEVTYRKQTQ